jgi:hydroxypyruvate isomerase
MRLLVKVSATTFTKAATMPRFAANLSMLYPEHDFLDRFVAAANDGFTAVEFLFPYAYAKQDIAQRLQSHGLQQVLFNMSPGNWDVGERGLACLPGRQAEFRNLFLTALDYAEALHCPRIHVMAGLVPLNADPQTLRDTYVGNLQWASREAAAAGRTVLIEPINTRDMPRYFLNHQAVAHSVLADVGETNLKVQMDLYHCQIMEGDLSTKLKHYLPTGNVGHMQIAGVPQRQEPHAGELNIAYLFSVLDELEYDGWVGCEYRPADTSHGGTSKGLRWLHPYLR